MYPEIKSLKSNELVDFYTRLNHELQQQLLDGAEWDTVKEQMDYLTELSKEITTRRINFNPGASSPADRALRSEND